LQHQYANLNSAKILYKLSSSNISSEAATAAAQQQQQQQQSSQLSSRTTAPAARSYNKAILSYSITQASSYTNHINSSSRMRCPSPHWDCISSR